LETVDVVVIGAGVVGLAVGSALAQRLPGSSVFVLEAQGAIGTQTSSRNSEVIHSGLYYPKDSLKARLCVQGRHLLYRYLAERGLPFAELGKLIVATRPEQLGTLESLMRRGQDNGVSDLELLGSKEALQLEPALRVEGALWSPSTGILDSHALMLSLQGDMERAGGHVILNSPITGVSLPESPHQGGALLTTQEGTAIKARLVVNAAGLHAPQLARRFHGEEAPFLPQAHYAKGNYFSLQGPSPFKRLIYPVPEAAGLGVHLTLDLAGRAKFGPDVEWVDRADDLTVNPTRGEVFYEAIRQYWPDLQDGSLVAAYAGMRPKIHSKTQDLVDFCVMGPSVHQARGVVHLMGIESPGLTSSLALAQEVILALEIE
jgi:L-2-hydroxyglutarate oxidase LhgO